MDDLSENRVGYSKKKACYLTQMLVLQTQYFIKVLCARMRRETSVLSPLTGFKCSVVVVNTVFSLPAIIQGNRHGAVWNNFLILTLFGLLMDISILKKLFNFSKFKMDVLICRLKDVPYLTKLIAYYVSPN